MKREQKDERNVPARDLLQEERVGADGRGGNCHQRAMEGGHAIKGGANSGVCGLRVFQLPMTAESDDCPVCQSEISHFHLFRSKTDG